MRVGVGAHGRLVALAVAATLALAALGPRSARADDSSAKAVCAEKYQSAQRLRAAGRLTLARADLLRCAEQTCPAFVSNDCKTWLAEVESELPTLVFAVLDPDGRDVPNAAVRVDGAVVPHATDGLGHPVDPGERAIQVLAGDQRIAQRIVVRVGEKSRRVELRFEGAVPASATASANDGSVEPAPFRATTPVPTAAYVLGGLGVVAIGVGTALWVSGTRAAHTYNDDCAAAGCTEDQRSSVQRRLVAGDIAWAAGIAAGAATVAVVLAPRAGTSGPRVSVGVGGVAVSEAF